MAYNRDEAVAYAHKWAFKRNPRYMDFHGIGGDCTNFVSQCLYAGGAPMNYIKELGWYYNSASDRAPAWTGVQYLYNFLTGGHGKGPFAVLTDIEGIERGDIVQLAFTEGRFTHSLLVVERGVRPSLSNVLTATHTIDSDYRPLSTYFVAERRFLHIGVR